MSRNPENQSRLYIRADKVPEKVPPRIPYIEPAFPDISKPVKEPAFMTALAQTAARRSTQGGLNSLDLTLLHSPPLTTGWNGLLGVVRTGLDLSDAVREMIICRIAVINGARFEWDQHLDLFREGWRDWVRKQTSDEEKVEAAVAEAVFLVRHVRPRLFEEIVKNPEGDGEYADVVKRALIAYMDLGHMAIMAYTDTLTLTAHTPDSTWQMLKEKVEEKLESADPDALNKTLVEITGTIASYNAVSRFLNALHVNGNGDWDTS